MSEDSSERIERGRAKAERKVEKGLRAFFAGALLLALGAAVHRWATSDASPLPQDFKEAIDLRPSWPENPVDDKIYTITVDPGVNIRSQPTIAQDKLGETPRDRFTTTQAIKKAGHRFTDQEDSPFIVRIGEDRWGVWFQGTFETNDGERVSGYVTSHYVHIEGAEEASPEEQDAVVGTSQETAQDH